MGTQHRRDPAPFLIGRPVAHRQAGQDGWAMGFTELPQHLGIVHHVESAVEIRHLRKRLPHPPDRQLVRALARHRFHSAIEVRQDAVEIQKELHDRRTHATDIMLKVAIYSEKESFNHLRLNLSRKLVSRQAFWLSIYFFAHAVGGSLWTSNSSQCCLCYWAKLMSSTTSLMA